MRKLTFVIVLTIFYILGFNKPIQADTFSWPTSGWIGYRYKNTTTYCSGNCHTGIDIWSNADGDWNGGVEGASNPVYPVASGTLIWEDDNGFYIQHSTNLYTNYFHIRNRQVHPTQNVTKTTLIGYQDRDVVVHTHLTISTTPSDAGNIDPSSYLGLQLNVSNPNVIGYLTNYVQYSSGGGSCGGTDITKSNWNIVGPLDCGASSSITVLPESNISGSGGSVNIHVP